MDRVKDIGIILKLKFAYFDRATEPLVTKGIYMLRDMFKCDKICIDTCETVCDSNFTGKHNVILRGKQGIIVRGR